MYKLSVTEYSVNIPSLSGLCFALISDLHSKEGREVEAIINALKEKKPDYILAPGDIFERLDGSNAQGTASGFELLSEAAKIAPTLYSFGNHENGGIRSWNKLKWCAIKSIPKYYDAEQIARLKDIGVHVLDDEFITLDGIVFGGLSSGLINEHREPNTSWLDDFCSRSEAKVLLCHHPEYYKKYLADKNIDLIVAGHAHGGQWRFFGRGVFAPGQGLFPKYTSGVHDSRLVVSRGLKPSGHIPRIFNTPEIVFVNVK